MKWISIFLPVLSASLFADEAVVMQEENLHAVLSNSSSHYGDFINMLITLTFLVVVIFLSIFFLKKIMRRGIRHSMQGKGIKILQRKSINSKASLYLVDICGKGIVIADSPQGIQYITEFPEGTDLFTLLADEKEPKPSFKEILQNKIRSSFQRKKPPEDKMTTS